MVSSKPQTFVGRYAASLALVTIAMTGLAVFTLRGAPGRAIQEWKDSDGTVVCQIGSGGLLSGTCTTGLGGAVFGSGNVLAVGDPRYVNTAGDTMTGALTVNSSITLTGTLSGGLLKMSNISPRCAIGQISGSGMTLATGSGKNAFNVPTFMSGYVMRFAELGVGTAGATNETTVQARLLRGGTLIGKMFSTVISVDSAEYNSKDAATPAVINASAATVQGGDVIQFDVPAVSTTPPNIVQLTQCFYAP